MALGSYEQMVLQSDSWVELKPFYHDQLPKERKHLVSNKFISKLIYKPQAVILASLQAGMKYTRDATMSLFTKTFLRKSRGKALYFH